MSRKMTRIIKLAVSYIKELLYLLIYYKKARKEYKDKDVWLISERGSDARDNGMHLFRYVRTVEPQRNIYYVIDKSSSDLDNIIEYGNIIYSNSKEHRMLFYGANVLISTHLMGGYTTNQSFYMHFHKQPWFRRERKIVSIKHGITKDDLPILYKENADLDLLICGAKIEYDYILRNFHYSEKEVKYTGFARFDKLQSGNEINQILVMPTWRSYLSGCSNEEFRQSEYFKRWTEFLSSKKLNDFLKKQNYNLIFYPHHDVQPYLKEFEFINNGIIIASSKDYDVQDLLLKSKLLITDYSSVYFDFAYMRKPVLYYQFDKEVFFSRHYKKGYFDYETMGFGMVLENANSLLEELISISERSFTAEDKYNARADKFFLLRDKNNCSRIFKEINNIVSQDL